MVWKPNLKMQFFLTNIWSNSILSVQWIGLRLNWNWERESLLAADHGKHYRSCNFETFLQHHIKLWQALTRGKKYLECFGSPFSRILEKNEIWNKISRDLTHLHQMEKKWRNNFFLSFKGKQPPTKRLQTRKTCPSVSLTFCPLYLSRFCQQ